ncbi:zinc finger protein 184-like [Battus philenor]|uniref:zinc finger protein 184-like n=1 Tax=Battus philenor TaxID=42288 RepID=UPI0035D08927
MEVFLYNSTVCRLCGEENDNGNLLYLSEENNQNLSEIINTYLPIKVSDDGHLPRTICPGCTIQLEATVEFLNLIINGQKVLRELYQREKEYKKSYTPSNDLEVITEKIIYEINTSDGVYQIEHPISLQVAGLEKPKRKRGRPPKKPKSPEELAKEASLKVQEEKSKNEGNDSDEPTGKRRRKTPTRFKEVVQGKELERIFKEEGVTDGEESDSDSKQVITDQTVKVCESKEPEVIGHMETSGELVVVVKGKGRGRPKGRTRQTREQCMICGMLFSSIGRYMSHIAQHGPVLYQCTQCSETFSTRLRFCDHQTETKHIGQNILQCKDFTPTEPSNTKTGDVEETKNATEKSLKKTQESTVAPVNNLVSNEQSTSLPANLPDALPDLSFKVEDNNDESSKEVKTEPEKAELNSSEETSKNKEATAEKQMKVKDKISCNQCGKEFRSRQSKSLHIKAVHQGEKPFKCGECGAAFGYPRSLALHSISHRRHKSASSKGYACDLCGKVLNHPSSVVYHKQAAHAGQRYVCGTCGKHFRHKQLLQRHQLVHSQLRPFNCKTCSATFKTKANLINHQLLHSGVKKFICEICKHKFAHKTSLTLHMRWHTGVKPYSCKMCGKSFSQKGNLSEHERIHTGEKPYQCTWCPRRFTTSSQHRLHARRHAAERTHCAHCSNRFATRSGWSSAVRREAGGRLRCTVCGRVFVERAALPRHARRHAAQANRQAKQVSLLVPEPQQVQPEVESIQPAEDSEDGVIYITYDVDEPESSLHILERDQTVSFDDAKILSTRELYSGPSLLVPEPELEQLELQQLPAAENDDLPDLVLPDGARQHLPVTDEHGNPLHFTMQDGTRLAITSADGKSLQVITQDGQTIPVEINGFTDEEEVDSPDTVVHQLNLQKSVDGAAPLTHYYTLA